MYNCILNKRKEHEMALLKDLDEDKRTRALDYIDLWGTGAYIVFIQGKGHSISNVLTYSPKSWESSCSN